MLNAKGYEIIPHAKPLKKMLDLPDLSPVDFKSVVHAEEKMATMVDGFTETVASNVAEMRAAFEDLANDAARAKGVMMKAAFSIKGEAGTFACPLAGEIGGRLFEFLRGREVFNGMEIEAVKVFIDSIEVAIKARLADRDDPICIELLDGLDGVEQKLGFAAEG